MLQDSGLSKGDNVLMLKFLYSVGNESTETPKYGLHLYFLQFVSNFLFVFSHHLETCSVLCDGYFAIRTKVSSVIVP